MDGKNPGLRKWRINGRSFSAVTAGAVLVALILIVVGRASIPFVTSTPPETLIATLPISSPANPSVIIDTTKGAVTAPVTIIEYSDFQCAHCQEFALTVEKEMETAYIDTGKVRLIYKFIAGFGEESRLANLAAASAAEQEQFWPYYYLVMQQRASPKVPDLTTEKLQELAHQLGLDMDKFNSSFLNRKFAAYIDKDDAEGRASGVTGTPTFFINGIKKEGAESLQDLQAIIDPVLENLAK